MKLNWVRITVYTACFFTAIMLGRWQGYTAGHEKAQAEAVACPPVDQRQFFQEKDGLWIELRELGNFSWRQAVVGIDVLGGVHVDPGPLTDAELQLAASALLRKMSGRSIQ